MQSHAKVVIVGGGVGGLSALYHLCLEGWTDAVLLERNELTSGTTWHSAAQCPSIAFNQLLLLLRDYSIKLYRELAADTAYRINYHHATGGRGAPVVQPRPPRRGASHHVGRKEIEAGHRPAGLGRDKAPKPASQH
ncbi:FAD-binding oxidoreductase [Rhodobacter sp. HX-7-19]|uniref:FAD-binding oxidoreductase n=1 Tax=Paragemmobacter kunshanensis TaxID=2583234 RepID=A0A6M1U018_9RHOB|nr:FAD-binding oxidoreductase [Rhodobacter kunshanensis]